MSAPLIFPPTLACLLNATSEPRRRFWANGAAIGVSAVMLASCSAIATFDRVVSVEPGGTRGPTDVPYGDAPRQRYDVYLPAARGLAPVVVFIYGGSWRSGSRDAYSFVGRSLAARGFVAVIPDYRLAPEVTYPAFVQDTAAAVAHVYRHAAEYGGDPSRLFLVGHSAGAYNAMMVALAPEFLKRQGLQRSIIKGAAGVAGPYDFLPIDNMITRSAFGADPSATSLPINAAQSGAPAILLQHGSADTTVDVGSSRTLLAALRQRNIPAELQIYPGAGHFSLVTSITTTFRKYRLLDDLVDFFNRHGAHAAPPPNG